VASPLAKLPSATSRPAITPELKEFIDTLLVPMLVRDALFDFRKENHLASAETPVARSVRSGNAQ